MVSTVQRSLAPRPRTRVDHKSKPDTKVEPIIQDHMISHPFYKVYINMNTAWEKLSKNHAHAYSEKFTHYQESSKDLVVFIQSRSRPALLNSTIADLYGKAESLANFDIVCLVDKDQRDLYQDVIKNYPNVLWKHPPHSPHNWALIKEIQHNFIRSNDCYFNWMLADDQRAFNHHWDARIFKEERFF